MKTIYQDLGPDERVSTLEAMCDAKENFSYTKHLSRDELDEYRENLTDTMVKQSAIESEFADVKEEFKKKLKPVMRDVSQLFGIVKAKAIEVDELCFLIPDYNSGMMEYYNANGELVNSRRLKPEERQTAIRMINQSQF